MGTTNLPAVPTVDYSEQIAKARKFLISKGIYEIKSVYAKGEGRGNGFGVVSKESGTVLRWSKKGT